MWKIKGDDKIGNALAGLINAMRDLGSLAAEHDIEGQLYEGGGLEKVMTLIGEYRHRKFRSQNLGPLVSKKDDWDKLLEFLKNEHLLREKLALDNKAAMLMGMSTHRNNQREIEKNKNENPKKSTNSSHTVTCNDMKCHICEKTDHTVITTSRGNQIIPYVCEKFVNMPPMERLSQLKSKSLCTGCLFPGAIKGPKHKCFFVNYCCPHLSHGKEKLHVLLCETHKKDDGNVKLLEEFKDKFIRNSKVKLPQCSKHIFLF